MSTKLMTTDEIERLVREGAIRNKKVLEAHSEKCRRDGIDVDNATGLLDGEEIDDSNFQGYDNTPITDEDFYRAFGMKKEDAGKGLLP